MQMDNGCCCFSGGGDVEGKEASRVLFCSYPDDPINALQCTSLKHPNNLYEVKIFNVKPWIEVSSKLYVTFRDPKMLAQ